MLAAFTGLGFAQPSPSKVPPVKFSDTTLDNGLRVIISEDHYAPVYAIAVSYKVGSRDERLGRTGFAHLFEHMMFKGSDNVGPGEHFSVAEDRIEMLARPDVVGSFEHHVLEQVGEAGSAQALVPRADVVDQGHRED